VGFCVVWTQKNRTFSENFYLNLVSNCFRFFQTLQRIAALQRKTHPLQETFFC